METYVAPWPIWVFLGIVLGIIAWWFYMVSQLFAYISRHHQETYRDMGSPTLFMNNSIGNNISFIGFILRGKYKALNDPSLTKQCRFIKVFFCSYMVGFFLLIIGVFSFGNS